MSQLRCDLLILFILYVSDYNFFVLKEYCLFLILIPAKIKCCLNIINTIIVNFINIYNKYINIVMIYFNQVIRLEINFL